MDVGKFKVPRQDRTEYLGTIVRMIRAAKTRLWSDLKGVGMLFAVSTSTPGRLRPVWHGGAISEACTRPPPPTRLGNPASFLELQFEPGESWFFSKRDAASFFDTLKAPPGTHRWFCAPPVRADELAECLGCSVDDLHQFAVDGRLEK